jgi:hypothetical protein
MIFKINGHIKIVEKSNWSRTNNKNEATSSNPKAKSTRKERF